MDYWALEVMNWRDAEWHDISTAPASGWIMATNQDKSHLNVLIKTDEEGWWEDETGDYTVEARHNDGHGITQWAYLPDVYVVSDYEGTLRDKEPKARPANGG